MTTQTRILLELQQLNQRLVRIEQRLNADTEKLIGIAKAAEISGLTKTAIRLRAQRGTIPCVKDGTGHLIFRKEDILNIIR